LSDPGSPDGLKQRVEARDRLVLVAERTGQAIADQVGGALNEGDLERARQALAASERQLAELAESLRIYQAELHAQADELAASQARTERLLARFSALFAHMPVAALLVGPQGDVVEHNGRAEALFGLRTRAASGRFMHRLVQPEAFQTQVRPAMHLARARGEAVLEAVDFLGEAGRAFVGEMHIAWLPGDSDEPQDSAAAGHHVFAVVDRTESLQTLAALRASEAALREREALLSQTARLARVGGWALTLNPQSWQATDQLRELLDLAPDEGLSLGLLLSCCASTDRPRLRQALHAATEGEPFALELDLVTPSGRALRASITGQPECKPGDGGQRGEVQRVVGLLQDVSRRHDDQRLIGELSDRLAVVNEAGGVGVWDWDLLRDEVVVDARMARLLGLPGPAPMAATRLRQALEGALPPDEAERLDAALLSVVQRGGAVNLELRLAAGPDASAPGSDERWLHMTGRAQADAEGRVRRIVGCAWEHRTHYRATREAALRETTRLAEHHGLDALARMSHELRTPLNAILGFSQLMRLEAEAGDLSIKPQRLALLDASARTLWQLLDEVQELARAESGQAEMRRETLDLHRLLSEALAAVGEEAASLGVGLRDEVSDWPPLAAYADAQRLQEVLVRLLAHALHRSPPGSTVRVQGGLDRGNPGAVWLKVSDAGPALTPAALARLFHPFASSVANADDPRDGMSLFLGRRFAELMGGRLEAESPAVGGLRLTLVLPPG
jgi:PAS domain S-box-containing protein